MDVVLAVLTSSPYRDSVAKFADDFAASIQGRVRVLAPAHVSDPAEVPLPATDGDDADRLLERATFDAERDVALLSPGTRVTGEWALGPPVVECVREMAQCDFGVVGRTLAGPLPGGQTLGRRVIQLKRACTKPLAIVPEAVRPLRNALFVYTNHPESGHALSLARPLSEAGKTILVFEATPRLGRIELEGTASAYLREHHVSHETVKYDCSKCDVEGGAGGPVGDLLNLVDQKNVDLVVMGGTRRGFFGSLLWPEMAYEVAQNIKVPLLIWY
jgi:nucleotide-binding universal stress UspA family protein